MSAEIKIGDAPPRAILLRLEDFLKHEGIGIKYRIDEIFDGTFAVSLPDFVMASESESASIQSAMSIILAQFCLPRKIELKFPISKGSLPAMKGLLRMLYDIRAACDETDFAEYPLIEVPNFAIANGGMAGDLSDPQKVLLALSGGFDSTLAAIILQEAGYKVVAAHFTENLHSLESELDATIRIAEALGIELHRVDVSFPNKESLGRYFSRSFGQFPFHNSVPHGRDILLAAAMVPLARSLGCAGIAFGHDRESRRKVYDYNGRPIHRHDVESSRGFDLLKEFVKAGGTGDIRLFSPLAGLSTFMVRHSLIRNRPDIAKLTRSCFWGDRCGKCLKCVVTYALEKYESVILSDCFIDPFNNPDDENMRIFSESTLPSEQIAYGTVMHYLMSKMNEQGFCVDTYWMKRFNETAGNSLSKRIKELTEICLLNCSLPEFQEYGSIKPLEAIKCLAL